MWFILVILLISIILGSILDYIIQKIIDNKNRKDKDKNDK